MTLASTIDHTLLNPLSTEQDVYRVCQEAIQYGFAAVCVLPTRVEAAARFLSNTPGVKVRTVDMKRFDEEVRTLLDIFNDAWSDNWGA